MKISIFITSFNQKKYLKEAVESALAQTLRPFQIIIVDDNSSDGSQELIKAFHSKHPQIIHPIFHTQNTGVARVRIDALRTVRGDYVTYIDGDDRFLPEKIEKEAKVLLSSRSADIAFSNNFYIRSDGTRFGMWIEEEKPPVGDVFCQTFAREFPKRSLFRMELVNIHRWRKVGFHDDNLKLYEDFDMRIRLTKKLQVAYCDEPLSEIRFHGMGLSSASLKEHFKALDYIYRKNRHLLNDLDEEERQYIDKRLRDWIGSIVDRAFVESCNSGKRLTGLWLIFAGRRYKKGLFSWTSFSHLFSPKHAVEP